VNRKIQQILGWLIIALAVLVVMGQFTNTSTTGSATPVAYSDFLAQVKSGNIVEVKIEDNKITARTANGAMVTTTTTLLDRGLIGDLVESNVRAIVIDSDMPISLLGMSYLRRFARVSFEGDMMVLER